MATSPPTILAETVPCGGIVKLTYTYDPAVNLGPWSLTRAASGSTASPTHIYTGVPIILTIDAGDGANLPLNPATTYIYALTTPDGVVTTSIQPASTISIDTDDVTTLMFRVLQGAFAGLNRPDAHWSPPSIIQAMPLTGQPKLPIISLSDSLLQQTDTPIGENIDGATETNDYFIRDIVSRRYRVTVLCLTVEERSFYTKALIGIFKSVMGPLLESIGQNIRHRYQAAYSQVTGESNNPGFYFSDLMLEFSGSFYVTVRTNYGVISVINPEIEANPPANP